MILSPLNKLPQSTFCPPRHLLHLFLSPLCLVPTLLLICRSHTHTHTLMHTHPSPILLSPRRCVRLREHVKAVTQGEAHVFLIWSHLPKACCQPPSGYVCVCVCVCLCMFTCQWPGVVSGECLCRCFACTEGWGSIFAGVWVRPCGTPLHSRPALSVPTLRPHLYLNLLSPPVCSTEQTLF